MNAALRMLAQTTTHAEPDYERLAQIALGASGLRAVRELTVERNGDSLLLIGKVSTFYQKQVAQELVRAIAGPLAVLNEVEVP